MVAASSTRYSHGDVVPGREGEGQQEDVELAALPGVGVLVLGVVEALSGEQLVLQLVLELPRLRVPVVPVRAPVPLELGTNLREV